MDIFNGFNSYYYIVLNRIVPIYSINSNGYVCTYIFILERQRKFWGSCTDKKTCEERAKIEVMGTNISPGMPRRWFLEDGSCKKQIFPKASVGNVVLQYPDFILKASKTVSKYISIVLSYQVVAIYYSSHRKKIQVKIKFSVASIFIFLTRNMMSLNFIYLINNKNEWR